MGAVCISETDIHRHRFTQPQSSAYNIIHSLHQFCGSGKTILPGRIHFHYNQFRAGCCSPVPSAFAAPAVSRGNARHRCSVSAQIPAGEQIQPCRGIRFLQRPVNLFAGKFTAQIISLRRISGNRLIPERCNPGGSVLVSEIRIGIINTAVYNSYQHTLPGQ